MSWDWMEYVVAAVFALLGVACVVLVVFQMPGSWIMIGLALLIEWLDQLYRGDDRWTFSLLVLILAAALAVIGEIVEFIAGLLGARHGGASRRGMWGALIGGVAGAFTFQGLFFFVPVFAALLGALLGTFVGAVIGEMTAESATVRGSVRPAVGATIGRVFGTVGKVATAMGIWALLVCDAFWP